MPEQFDPRIYERFVAPSVPVNQEQINQYSQQDIPVAVPVPEIQNYAPQQQFAQQSPQQMLRPSDKRIAYNKLIEDRFNEIVNYAGGMERAIKANALQAFQQKAIKDIQSYYGDPPAIEQPEQPLRTQVIPGTGKMIVMGAGMPSPQFVDVNQLPDSAFTAYPVIDSQTGKPIAGKALVNGKIVDVPVDPSVSGEVKLSTADILNNAVDEMNNLLGPLPSSNETAKQKAERERKEGLIEAAAGKSGTFYQALSDRLGIPTTESGTRAEIEALKSKVTAIGSSIFKGQGSFSNEERAMIGQALAGINMAGTDEQALRSLRSLQARMIEIANRKKGQGANTVESGQSAVPPKMEMAINPATGRYEPVK